MIYLDNSATTQIDTEVFEAMKPYLTEEYGNPSSKYYPLSTKAKDAVELSRHYVAKLINAKDDEIIFTSGATESTNTVIKGVADYKKFYESKGNHIITSKVEHKATLNTCKFLNGEIYSNKDATFSFGIDQRKVDRGFEVTFLDVNRYGQVEIEELNNAITPKTILASFIWANNEIGSINDIPSLSKQCHKHGILIHSDATQAVGKVIIDVKKVNVNFLSLSAHKIYGPKGIGAAFIKGDDYGLPPISSLLHGGEQENGIRAGTLAVHNIVGFGKAAELVGKSLQKQVDKISKLHKFFVDALINFPNVELLGHPSERVFGIISFVVNKAIFNNELFIKDISDKMAISTGSACTAGQPSHVLKAIGRSNDTGNVLRVSIGKNATIEDINVAIEILKSKLL